MQPDVTESRCLPLVVGYTWDGSRPIWTVSGLVSQHSMDVTSRSGTPQPWPSASLVGFGTKRPPAESGRKCLTRRHRVRRSQRRALALRRSRPARPRCRSLGGRADLAGSLLVHIAAPRGSLHGLPVAWRMLGQVRLFAGREFRGAAAGWAC
jgi:hypothetical protein